MEYRVFVSNLKLRGNHGVLDAEKSLGQFFYIDISCMVERQENAVDDIDMTVCYGALCDLAMEISDSRSFDLIETFGHEIAMTILQRFKLVKSVEVEVRKPGAPLAHSFDHVGISVVRHRND